MRKIIFTVVAAASLLGMASCENGLGNKDPQQAKYTDYSGGRIQLVLPASKTVEADADGVSISIKQLDASNVVFECRPGAYVLSYYVDVIPLSLLYNTLINEDLVDASRLEVEDVITKLLMGSASTNGVVFSEKNLDDYYSHTFDWMNSTYHNGSILTDCDYVICVAPCFDEEGLESANVNLCWFRTDARELVGDPDVRIDVSTNYRSFSAVHDPNDDCKYICYWSYLTDEIDAYVDVVGDRMLRDFVRTASATYDVANVADIAYNVDFGQSADAEVSQTSVAVALDVNGTPAETYTRRDFYLKPIPESPMAVYDIKPYKSAASIFWIEVAFEPTCKNCYYRWMSKDQAAVLQAYTKEQKDAYARALVAKDGGWGVSNPSFHFDADRNLPTGDAASVIEHQIVAYEPAPEYVIVSAGENYYGEVTELKFSEPIVMKKRNIDSPSTCLISDSELTLTLDNVSRTGFRYNFNYSTPEDIAMIYFQIVAPVDDEARETKPELCPPEDIYGATHAQWMKFFFETYIEAADGEKVLQVNTWKSEPQGHDALSMFGYEPGIEYVVAYCVEDINGVISNVRLEKVKTQEVAPGANPSANISAALADGEWTFTFSANEDTGTLLYMTSSYGDANYDLLGLPYLINDPYKDYPDYASFYDLWDEKIMSLGLSTKSLTTYATEAKRDDKSFILALCLPVGADAEGKPVYGDLQHVLIVDGQVKKLEDYRAK